MRRVGWCLALLVFMLMMQSCASLARYKGVGRIRRYTIEDARLPREFDGFKIAFISDTHYPSKFTRKRLASVMRALGDIAPSALMLGGDYVTFATAADELFAVLGGCDAPYGKFAVLGNHDIRIADTLQAAMERNGIKLLSDEADTLRIGGAEIYLCGVQNYSTSEQPSWVRTNAADGFTLLLVHTPDYPQDTSMDSVALVLSGHTHGGQVTLFGLHAPETNSRYGRRFLSGLNFTDKNIPVVTSNGLGTSRRKIRFCAPSDIVVITLRCLL